jgi:hypothetical protein
MMFISINQLNLLNSYRITNTGDMSRAKLPDLCIASQFLTLQSQTCLVALLIVLLSLLPFVPFPFPWDLL